MTFQHPENDGSFIYAPYSDGILKEAERIVRKSKYKHICRMFGRGAMYMVSSYGMTASMHAELSKKEK